MYISIHLYIYLYIYVFIHLYLYTYAYTYICIQLYNSVCIYQYMYLPICVCTNKVRRLCCLCIQSNYIIIVISVYRSDFILIVRDFFSRTDHETYIIRFKVSKTIILAVIMSIECVALQTFWNGRAVQQFITWSCPISFYWPQSTTTFLF